MTNNPNNRPEVTEEDFRTFVRRGKLDLSILEEISRQLEIVGSPVHQWFDKLKQGADNAWNVNWGKLTEIDDENTAADTFTKKELFKYACGNLDAARAEEIRLAAERDEELAAKIAFFAGFAPGTETE